MERCETEKKKKEVDPAETKTAAVAAEPELESLVEIVGRGVSVGGAAVVTRLMRGPKPR